MKLKVKIWTLMVSFSVLILGLLWFFQIISLNKFYEKSKVREINKTVNDINEAYYNEKLLDDADLISHDTGICLQIISSNALIYDSSNFNRGCLPEGKTSTYQEAFMASLEQNQTYKINNPRYGNDVLIKAIRLNPSTFVFISSSITPLDNAIDILKNQLIIISIIVLILAFLIGYIISVKISTPILTITDTAQNLENGNYEDAVFVVDSDIEELNDLTQVLNKTAVELSQTSKLQHELMANVSHDLKTPLTMIKAYAEMIRDLKSANKRDENLNIIINETDRLNNLVNDIMALSSLKANMAPIERETFDLNNVINETIKQFSITDVKFEFNAPRETNVYANKQQITQVIYNLVNNAVNYTGDDRTVQILITNHTKNYHISIKDSGKGISPEDLKLVWKRYYKADKSYKRSKGTGIGLSIVENIYQKHDMNYGVESKIGKGTNFWFELPKAKNIK